MKLPVIAATLLLATTTALPAFAAPSGARGVVRYEQGYRDGSNAYAAAVRADRQQAARSPAAGWGHCLTPSDGDSSSAFPSWDLCR